MAPGRFGWILYIVRLLIKGYLPEAHVLLEWGSTRFLSFFATLPSRTLLYNKIAREKKTNVVKNLAYFGAVRLFIGSFVFIFEPYNLSRTCSAPAVS